MKNLINRIKTNFKIDYCFYIGLLILVLLGGYLFFGKHFLVSNEMFSIKYMSVLFSIFLFLFVGFLIFDYLHNKTKPNYIFLFFMVFLCATQLFAIFVNSNTFEISAHGADGNLITVTIEVDNIFKINSILSFISLAILLYVFVVILPKKISPKSIILTVFVVGVIVFALVASIYSFATEYDKYYLFFKDFKQLTHEHFTRSFLPHKNNWGLLLMAGVYCTIYLSFIVNRRWVSLTSLYFFILMIFSMCKATLIISVIIYCLYFTYFICTTYSTNKKRNSIILGSVGGAIVVLLIVLFATPIRDVIISLFFGNGGASSASRFVIWAKIFEITYTPLKILFGNGFGILGKELLQLNNQDPSCTQNWGTFKAHNMYIQSYGDGGVVLLITLVVVIGYIANKMVVYHKENKDFSFVMLLGFVSLLAMWFFES